MSESSGAVLIAPEVLTTVVRQVVETTPGVAGLSTHLPRRMSRVWRGKRSTGGVQVEIVDGAVTIDVYIVALPNTALLALGKTLQHEIHRAISEVVGMAVRAVNIQIADVQDPFDAE